MLHAQPLSAAGFSPFGNVVCVGAGQGLAANLGTAQRFDGCAPLIHGSAAAKPNLAVFASRPVALPFSVTLLERHPHSTQLFVPMVCGRFLVVVAPTSASGAPDAQALRAFVGLPGQAVAYAPGVWHHPILALDVPAQFVMLAWEEGGPEDCIEAPLPRPVAVQA